MATPATERTMNKSTVVFLVLGSQVCLPLHAGEMFESYPKKFALGYVEDLVNLRYWFNAAWAVDMTATIDDRNATAKFDDGVVTARDEDKSNGYTIGFSAVRAIKNYRYFDLNVKGGFLYSSVDGKSDPEGPNNDSSTDTSSQSVFLGPEIEIKIPHFSRLVIVSSLQLAYTVVKSTTTTQDIAGVVRDENKIKSFGFESNENSLDELVHLGIRYYF